MVFSTLPILILQDVEILGGRDILDLFIVVVIVGHVSGGDKGKKDGRV